MVPLVKISLWDYKSIAKQLVFLKATSRSQNRRVCDGPRPVCVWMERLIDDQTEDGMLSIPFSKIQSRCL